MGSELRRTGPSDVSDDETRLSENETDCRRNSAKRGRGDVNTFQTSNERESTHEKKFSRISDLSISNKLSFVECIY